jgi:hypothetical protein
MEFPLGTEGKVKVSFSAGKAKIEGMYAGADAEAGAFVSLSIDAYLDALKNAIPGHFDDVLLDGAKALLKAL